MTKIPQENLDTEPLQEPEISPSWPLTVLALTLAFTVLTVGLVVWTSVPLGIPGEWTWRRYTEVEIPWFECAAIILGFGFACFCAHVADFARKDRRLRVIGLIGLLLALAWIDIHVLLAGKIGLAENIYAVLDRHTTGYLAEAARIDEPGPYFRSFHNLRSQVNGPVHHLDVHPPGNMLLSWQVLSACRRFPRLTQWLASRLSADARMGLSQAKQFRYFESLLDDDAIYRAACVITLIFLVGMTVTRACVVAGVACLSRRYDRLGLAGLATLAVPAPILFLGHYDVLLFCLSSLWACLLIAGLTAKEGSAKAVLMMLAGLVAGIGVVVTLGYGVLIALATVVLLAHGARHRNSWLALFAFCAGGGIVVLLCYLGGIHIIEICFACMRNNTEFYLDTSRSWRWIFVNPLEFAVFLGFPWLLALPSWYRGRRTSAFFEADGATVFKWAAGVFLLYLMIHPYCRGEIARLSLLFAPVLLIPCIQTLVDRAGTRHARAYLLATIGAVLLQIVAMRMALKLAFFHGAL